MTFSEQALLDKQQGTLNKSVLSQTYQYKKSPENDVLNMDFNARTASNLALLSQKYFDKDASKDLFGETIQFPSNPRALAQLKTDTKLFDINHSAKMARESINRFADNIESESRKLGVLDEHEKRILENAPSAEKLGETYLIILANKPSILFEYGFKFFVEVNLYKDYYKNFAALDDATGLDLYKSYINTAYEVKMSILQGDTSIRDVSLVTGAIKLNTTLLDMLSNIESFEKEVFKYLKG